MPCYTIWYSINCWEIPALRVFKHQVHHSSQTQHRSQRQQHLKWRRILYFHISPICTAGLLLLMTTRVCGGKYFFVEVIIEEVALCEPFLLRIVCQPPNLYVTYNQYGNKRKIQKSKKKSKLCVSSCLTFISPPTNMARGVEWIKTCNHW